MSKQTTGNGLQWLTETYFSDPSQQFVLNAGDTLLEQGGLNDRLFLVLSGSLVAYADNPGEDRKALFKATRDMFVGVFSFFSKTNRSISTVVAEEKTRLAYIDRGQESKAADKDLSLIEQFIPVVVMDMAQRQQREVQNIVEKERTLKQLYRAETMASLGQMAAGIAHELNNAVTVLHRNTHWLQQQLSAFLCRDKRDYDYYQLGLEQGRSLSSREIRKRSKKLAKAYEIGEENARLLAEMNIPDEWLAASRSQLDKVTTECYGYWELGASFHDMGIAAKHAIHVVGSVRALASSSRARDASVIINETIQEAIALVRSPLRGIGVKLTLGECPPIEANRGELMQVWTNLIKNAIDSMTQARTEAAKVTIVSGTRNNAIIVTIKDNGPGIPKEVLGKIFQPSFTTKERGLEFGLGLGLTIVERIIHSYGGNITVKSKPGQTTFKTKIPV